MSHSLGVLNILFEFYIAAYFDFNKLFEKSK